MGRSSRLVFCSRRVLRPSTVTHTWESAFFICCSHWHWKCFTCTEHRRDMEIVLAFGFSLTFLSGNYKNRHKFEEPDVKSEKVCWIKNAIFTISALLVNTLASFLYFCTLLPHFYLGDHIILMYSYRVNNTLHYLGDIILSMLWLC